MKKKIFLMTLVGAALTACSNHDFDVMTPGEIAQAKYEAAFVQRFGQPDANHTWGFGDVTRSVKTRSANTDGKSWLQSGYDNIPPADTKNYEAAVTEIFRDETKWRKYQVTGIDFSDFFVQQVHKGANDVCKYTSYKDGNGTKHDVYGPDLMNQLVCQKKDGTVEHVNNFNYAEFNNGTWNQEVWNGKGGEYGYNDQNNLYKDAIILMQNSGTDAFGWSNSNDNGYYYTDAYMIIEYPENSGYYYVGFDYYRRSDDVLGDAYYSKQNEVNNKQNEINNKQKELNDNIDNWDENRINQVKNDIAQLETQKANLQAEADKYADCYKNGDKFVDRDYRYDDWIVRITPAKKQITPDIRVIAEDLTVAENGDFDFNDVVFDIILSDPANNGNTTIILQAAGGTLPLYVAGKEVHEAFGVGTNVMVNTKAANGVTKEPVTIRLDMKYDKAIDVPVMVKKSSDEMLNELIAGKGKVPSKIGVPVSYEWCDEREDIATKYPKFTDYVNNEQANKDWYIK